MPADKKRKGNIVSALESYCGGEIGQKQRRKSATGCFRSSGMLPGCVHGMPKKKVCERLSKKNLEICEVKFPIKVEKGAGLFQDARQAAQEDSCGTRVEALDALRSRTT